MRKIIVLLAAALLLVGCKTTENQPKIMTETRVVVDVPDDLYYCPVVRKLPDAENLTEREIAQLLVTLYKNNVTCKNSETAVKRFLAEAKKKIR